MRSVRHWRRQPTLPSPRRGQRREQAVRGRTEAARRRRDRGAPACGPRGASNREIAAGLAVSCDRPDPSLL